MRISFILVGTLFITILTLILFWVSKFGITYPKKEMVGEVRKIILLSFIPINGFQTHIIPPEVYIKKKNVSLQNRMDTDSPSFHKANMSR